MGCEHNITDGHTTITADDATPAQLFDLAHDMLDRLDGLEWAFACAVLIQLRHMDVVTDPGEETLRDTFAALHAWMAQYHRDKEREDRDRQFMGARE